MLKTRGVIYATTIKKYESQARGPVFLKKRRRKKGVGHRAEKKDEREESEDESEDDESEHLPREQFEAGND